MECNSHPVNEDSSHKLARFSLFVTLIFIGSIIICGASSAEALTDNTPPAVVAVEPANGNTNIASNKNITVTFDETIIEGNNRVELINSAGTAVPFAINIDDNVLAVKPADNLAESRYKLILHTGCVTDLSGNALAAKSIYFSVGTSPTVASTSPANGASNVVTSKTIKVTFNEAIKKGSDYLIEFKDSKGTPVTINKSISGKVLTITHTKPLAADTEYVLTLHSGCVTDLAGNPLVMKTIKFTSIYILDSTLGGDVLKNPEINQNIPKTNFSNEIFKMVKQGSVVLKFGNANGPKLLISAGIHGDEPEANIAIMKYLEYIKDKSFNGTLYVIPFDIPKNTAQNTRYFNGSDPNRIANKSGTPGWNIVKFAQNKGITYLLDVHSGGGVGKSGFIFLNSASYTQEKNWASFIRSKTGCYSGYNGADSPGMIRYFAHTKGINSITMEVERDTIPTVSAAETEFKMIMAAASKLGFDTTPPTITISSPANGTAKVVRNKNFTVNFNENIKAGTKYFIELVSSNGTSVTIGKSISGKVLTITHSSLLAKNTKYYLKLHTGCVTDKAGNPLAAKTISFTTGST